MKISIKTLNITILCVKDLNVTLMVMTHSILD